MTDTTARNVWTMTMEEVEAALRHARPHTPRYLALCRYIFANTYDRTPDGGYR
ncbi:hypothetical protein HH800_15755 [Sphingobium yanoikuyae]|uniref:Uncharacterized protein n=1 Tax=Sphingobium yanoikuyae TaxID=13690 RepID=A0A6M4G8D0_SPHYA|nr:hypothetical protein [Sphingobium yanoikuyae]QJR03505.1 hypothetical protein HH800_15755 [Sphingobium yanoikuyae]